MSHRLAFLVCAALACFACGSSSPTVATPPPSTTTTTVPPTPTPSTPPSGTYTGTLTDTRYGAGSISLALTYASQAYTGTWSITLGGATNRGTLTGSLAVITTARPLNLSLFLIPTTNNCGQATMSGISLDESKIVPGSQFLAYPAWNTTDCITTLRMPSSGTLGTLTKQ